MLTEVFYQPSFYRFSLRKAILILTGFALFSWAQVLEGHVGIIATLIFSSLFGVYCARCFVCVNHSGDNNATFFGSLFGGTIGGFVHGIIIGYLYRPAPHVIPMFGGGVDTALATSIAVSITGFGIGLTLGVVTCLYFAATDWISKRFKPNRVRDPDQAATRSANPGEQFDE